MIINAGREQQEGQREGLIMPELVALHSARLIRIAYFPNVSVVIMDATPPLALILQWRRQLSCSIEADTA